MTWNIDNIDSLAAKTCIVTGANSGIGFETAKAFGEKGATTILACRNQTKGEAALAKMSGDVHLMSMDLSDLESVKTFAAEFTERFGKLDILVNNAGVMIPPFGKTTDGFELQFGTNHLGHFALTAQLWPLLARAGGARVVNVSSMAHKFGKIDFDNLNAEKGYKAWPAYGQSKLANLLFTYELGRRAASANADVVVAASHPGWTATNLQKDAGFIGVLNPIFAMKPRDGAMPSLMAAAAAGVETGQYFGPKSLMEWNGAPGLVKSNKKSHDLAVAAKLWERSEELTGVEFAV